VKVLITSTPVLSRMWDVVPIGWALGSAGHDVLLAALPNPGIAEAAAETGLPALLVGPPVDHSLMVNSRLYATSAAAFVRSCAQVAGLLAHGVFGQLDYFRPQLVLHGTLDLAGPLVAQYLDVPAVQVSCGPPHGRSGVAELERGAVALRRRFGLDEQVRPPALVLDVCPPSYQDEASRLTAPHQPMRFVPYNGPGAVPGWLLDPPDRPRVVIASGTYPPGPQTTARVCRVIRELFPGLDILVVMADEAGPRSIVAAAGPKIVDWLPLRLLFAGGCELFVHHGMPGLTLTALSYGVPQLIVRKRDHPAYAAAVINSRLVGACGAGRSLVDLKMTDEDVAAALSELLDSQSCRRAAAAIAAEMAAQPSPGDVVVVLEGLAAGRHAGAVITAGPATT
jgi:UDP:flavonoid glycosyltransferase YjiC (YdhE family)